MKPIDFTYNLADVSRAMPQLIPPVGTFESIEWFRPLEHGRCPDLLEHESN